MRLQRLVPTQRWDDLSQAQHQRAFAVAGAQKAQLLADLAASVDTAIAQGKSIQWFAKNFDALVAKHGWNPRGGNDWRARVIYDTNISTSYAAGRLSQLQAGNYKYWIYKHSHLAIEPRPEHLALDGVVKPSTDPFWQLRYPPRGYGCKCRVVGVRTPQIAQQLGGELGKPLPEWVDEINPKTGLPVGVDKGWGAGLDALAEHAALIQHLARQAEKLPRQLSIALIQEWLKIEIFGLWFNNPQGEWPLVRLPDADAVLLGSGAEVRIAYLSAETAAKQKRVHGELSPEEYISVQRVVDEAQDRIKDGNSLIYVLEQPANDSSGGYVIVVKATRTGKALWVTSFRRLSRDQAERDAELMRLRKKG